MSNKATSRQKSRYKTLLSCVLVAAYVFFTVFGTAPAIAAQNRGSTVRVLMDGEVTYRGSKRLGAINTTQGVYDCFSSQKLSGVKITQKLMLDSTAKDFYSAVKEYFAKALPNDISVVYLNCHGGVENGMPWLRFHDGSILTCSALRMLLGQISGTVVLLLDCCRSGSFLGSDEHSGHFDTLYPQAGENSVNPVNLFANSKFKVITSTLSCENSYRISNSNDIDEAGMSTVFSRSLTEAAGWDLIKDKKMRQKADFNKNRAVTLSEAFIYIRSRVHNLLETTGVSETAKMYPNGDNTVIFGR